MTEEITKRLRASFDRQSLMTTLGAELTRAGPEGCEITAPITGAVLQQHGAAHAGLAFAIGDSAAGYSALATLPEGSEVMTVEMKINLLSPAVGDRLVARGRVLRAGRRLTVVAADVYAVSGTAERHIAALQGTMIPVEPATDQAVRP